MERKEEKAIILDFLPNGYPLEGKMMPIAQALGMKHFTLLELIPRRGITLQLKEEVYIGEGKRDKIYYIKGRLSGNRMTETAKINLQEFIQKKIEEDQQRFVDFFNNAQAINTRVHQLELLPGFGAKHTKAILETRKEKKFESFDDIKKRISNIPDPKKAIEKRILQELEGEERYKLFVS